MDGYDNPLLYRILEVGTPGRSFMGLDVARAVCILYLCSDCLSTLIIMVDLTHLCPRVVALHATTP